jgi:hypothetical protein
MSCPGGNRLARAIERYAAVEDDSTLQRVRYALILHRFYQNQPGRIPF